MIRSFTRLGGPVAVVVFATALPSTAAPGEPPSVQVVMPVVDGGVTVIVAPGTSAAASSGGNPAVTPPAPPLAPPVASAPAPDPAPVVTAPAASVPRLPSARPTYVTTPQPTTTAVPTAPTDAAAQRPTSSDSAILLGVFGHSTERAARFQEKMGRPVDVIGVFPARGSWETIMDTWWLDRAPQGFGGILDVGVPLWQEDGDLATAAQGGYDARWEELGRVIHARYPGSIVRIGWEFNLGGWHHHATDENVEQWKQAFRHASVALKKGGPSLLVDWNPNKGKGDSLSDASKAWPGDDVVDIVGLDAYDWWPAYSESTWPEHRDGDQGWKYWVDFARAHGKKFAVPEWGVAPGNDHGGGDNPYYIGVVMDFLEAEHARDGIVHSIVYFDETEGYIANSIADGQVPLAGTALAERVAGLGRRSAAARQSRVAPAPTAGGTPPSPGASAPSPVTPRPEDDAAPQSPSPETSSAAPTPAPSEDGWQASGGHGPVPR